VENKVQSQNYNTLNLTEHPFIGAWRTTYRKFGVKAKDHKPSAEAMIRRILKGENIPHINTIVDCYLIIMCKYFLPLGGYDLDRIDGDIRLRYSSGGEEFTPIGVNEEELTNPNEIVYSDDSGILTRRWNYRDCEKTKITSKSKNVALFVEAGEKTIPTSEIEKVIFDLKTLLQNFCGGAYNSFVAYSNKQEEWKLNIFL